MEKLSKNLVPIAIIIAGVLIAGSFIYINYQKGPKGLTGGTSSEILSAQEAAAKAIDYINKNLLRGKATASLIETLEENGLYKIKFSVGEQKIESYMTRDGKLFFPEGIDLTKVEPVAAEKSSTVGSFSVSSDEVCKENGKPIIYFFGSKSCPHCKWEHPVVGKVAEKFKEEIAFHNNMDSQNDMEIFNKYSTGGIPTLVMGCKYYRIGSGEGAAEEEETKNLTALICKLTGNKPADVCNQVQDLVNQIKD